MENFEKTYDTCKYFITDLCPHKDKELMKQFINDIAPGEGYEKDVSFDKASDVNKAFCHNCTSFITCQTF